MKKRYIVPELEDWTAELEPFCDDRGYAVTVDMIMRKLERVEDEEEARNQLKNLLYDISEENIEYNLDRIRWYDEEEFELILRDSNSKRFSKSEAL